MFLPLVLMPYALRRVSVLILAAVVRIGDESRDSDGVAIEVSEGRGNWRASKTARIPSAAGSNK